MPRPFTTASTTLFKNTLTRRLVNVTDRLNDLKTRLGTRPFIVEVVIVRWTGGRRDEGEMEEVSRTALLPTPKVSPLSSLAGRVMSFGQAEDGDISVSEISGRYTEDYFLGLDESGAPLGQDRSIFYDVTFLASGPTPKVRRFTLIGTPTYRTNTWKLELRRTESADPSRPGEL